MATEWKRVEKTEPKTPPPAHVIQKEREIEMLAKVRQTYQNYLSNAGEVRAAPGKLLDPDVTFAWVNTHPSRIVFYKTFSYKIVNSNPGQPDEDVETNWKQEDGTHVWGDVILMKIPRELKEAQDLHFHYKALDELQSESEFEQYAAKHGVVVNSTAK